MHRPLSMIAALLICLLGAAPAPAQTPSPDTTAAARSLLATMKFADQFKALVPVIMAQLKPVIVQGRPEVERDYDAIMPMIGDAFAPYLDDLMTTVAAIYASSFTVDELKTLEAFYRQPVGQKLLAKTAVLAQQTMAAGQMFGQKVGEQLRSRIVDELRKKGHKI